MTVQPFMDAGEYPAELSIVADYGIKFAVKRAKKGLSKRDLYRFKREFEVLKELRFPYIVEVYRYDETRNEYKMEYCDETLRDYIAKRHGTLSFARRKTIALQFLYGINYIHYRKKLHRDVSLQNVMMKVYDDAVLVQKCVANDPAQRYQRVRGIIADVERLAVSPTDNAA